MAYTVLARRYRSQSFDEVVGQTPIATTLKAAIAAGRVAHAYLFTGTRGVGKTSMARILARALNAPDTVADVPKAPEAEAYPPLEVQQRMAEAIMRGDDMNVIEIDGASNNSVEQARQLIANAGLSPTGNAHYKVYIIDEVHMLSGHAFNALLKTMEEPPGHVKFILCTTEPHKVPATIQSRCQKFEFRNIPTARIVEHLQAVLEKEKIQADEQVVWQVARLGDGSMRDALSLLDRLLAMPEGQTLTVEALERVLGLPDQQLVANLIDALAEGDVKKSLDAAAALLERGIGRDQLVGVLIERLRQLMLVAACGADSDLVELSDQARQEAAAQAQRFDAPGLVYMIALCENLQRSAKSSANPRALFDATIVRLALAEKMADVTALLGGGGSEAGSGSGSDGGGGAKKKAGGRAAGAGVSQVVAGQRERGAAEWSGDAGIGGQAADGARADEGGGPRRGLVDSGDVGAVWRALLEELGQRPAWGWLERFRPSSLGEDTLTIEPLPGHRELLGFVNETQRKQIGEVLSRLIDKPVRVEVQAPGGQAEGRAGAGPGGEANEGRDGTEGERQTSSAERRAALDLPLVKQVFESFPDATLVEVRREEQEGREKENGIVEEPV